MLAKWIDFKTHSAEYGHLTFVESGLSVPYEIKRVYYIYEVPGDVRRGFHAHRTLRQTLICINGSCEVLLDDGSQKETVILDNPRNGLLLETFIWREMSHFAPGTVLMCLASDHYNEDDYIRDYNMFLRECRLGGFGLC